MDISQSHHPIVPVSEASNKSLFHSKCFFLAIQSYSSVLFSRKKSAFPKKTESVLDSLGEFLKAFDQANKVSQFPLPKPKFEIGFTKTKYKLFSHCYKNLVELLNRQFSSLFRFETNKAFSIKNFEQYGDKLFVKKLSTWGTAKSNFSSKINFLLLTNRTFLRAIRMCSAFTPDCG